MKIGTIVKVIKEIGGGLPVGTIGTVVQGRGSTEQYVGKYISVAVDYPVDGHEANYPFLLYSHELEDLGDDLSEEDKAEPFVGWNYEEEDDKIEDLGHEDCEMCGTASDPDETEEVISFAPVTYGHPRFNEIVDEIKELHSDKNYDYARGGDPLGNFKRVARMIGGLTPAEYANHLMLKQVDAVNWGYLQGDDNKVESYIDKLRDIAVYAVLQIIMLEEEEDGEDTFGI